MSIEVIFPPQNQNIIHNTICSQCQELLPIHLFLTIKCLLTQRTGHKDWSLLTGNELSSPVHSSHPLWVVHSRQPGTMDLSLRKGRCRHTELFQCKFSTLQVKTEATPPPSPSLVKAEHFFRFQMLWMNHLRDGRCLYAGTWAFQRVCVCTVHVDGLKWSSVRLAFREPCVTHALSYDTLAFTEWSFRTPHPPNDAQSKC